MNYCLFKLRFYTPVHIGESSSARSLETGQMTFCADTLFSALAHASLSVGGAAEVETLCQYVKDEALLLSDAMPYHQANLYLPKPIALPKKQSEVDSITKKKMKKMSFIPVLKLNDFIDSLNGGKAFDTDEVNTHFGIKSAVVKAGIQGQEQTQPYTVGLFSFAEDCGLYCIIGYRDEKVLAHIKRLFKMLSIGGIGGKVSAGYGKFHIEDVIELEKSKDLQMQTLHRLLLQFRTHAVLLTTSLPAEKELAYAMEDASYGMERRGGFIHSGTYAKQAVKKKIQYFFSAGSVFKHRFQGAMYEAAEGGNHPVYRYAKPIFLGVDL